MASFSQSLIELEAVLEFCRNVSLQFTCCADTLRDLIETKLKIQRRTVAQYFENVKTGCFELYLEREQEDILKSANPNLYEMDVTLLTKLLLWTKLGLSSSETNDVKALRGTRNDLCHSHNGKIYGKSLFNATSKIILRLCDQIGSKFKRNMKDCINELESLQLIQTCSSRVMIKLINEQNAVTLVEVNEPEKKRETLLKFNLMKWSTEIAEYVPVEDFFSKLEERDSAFSKNIRKMVNEIENEQEKMYKIILHIAQSKSMDSILQLCNCVSQCNKLLGKVINDGGESGKQLDAELTQRTEDRIKAVLNGNIIQRKDKFIKCEELHVYIEENLGSEVDFKIVRDVVSDVFALEKPTENEWRFAGITWKQDVTTKHERVKNDGESKSRKRESVDKGEMDFESFVSYIAEQFNAFHREKEVSTALRKEMISEDTFLCMTDEELRVVFARYLEYVFGIEKLLKKIQSELKERRQSTRNKAEGYLREFDTLSKIEYFRSLVKQVVPRCLLAPAHVFVCPKNMYWNTYFIVKKTIQFLAACLNWRQNGTIHFGIKSAGKGLGEISGIPHDSKLRRNDIDSEIRKGIALCFSKEHIEIVNRCVRPVQRIDLKNEVGFVLEIDIVPYGVLLKEELFNINFPSKGNQRKTFFVFDYSSCIVPVPQDKINETITFLHSIVKKRREEELERLKYHKSSSDLGRQLVERLTAFGCADVSEEFMPVFFLGSIPDNISITNSLNIENALRSATAVFDFNSTTRLRKEVEHGSPYFTVKLAEDFNEDHEYKTFERGESMWIYCNGNEDLQKFQMDIQEWTNKRLEGPINAMNFLRKCRIPNGRVRAIFLVFEKTSGKDPMLEIAREAFLKCFKQQCIIIAESHGVIENYVDELTQAMAGIQDVEKSIFTDLNWTEISNIFQSVFRNNLNTVCKIPHSLGVLVDLSHKDMEKLKFSSIEILSAEQCKPDERNMLDEDEQKDECLNEEVRFYRGNPVSWWNFYYGDQVVERDCFSKCRQEIEKILLEDDSLVTYEIAHHPGAGGSTLGRHLIWHFSQKSNLEYPYRCCVVKKITENTVIEIDTFRKFQDDKPNPVIILLDHEKEGLDEFNNSLKDLAFRATSHGQKFALVIQISRVSMFADNPAQSKHHSLLLKHYLSTGEKQRFEKKFKQLENCDVNLRTLIAFNVMRYSFNKEYIRKEAEEILKSATDAEKEVLKPLALIGFFESSQVVPQCVFDTMMASQLDQSNEKSTFDSTLLSFGLLNTQRQRDKLARARYQQIWNVQMSEAMSILICKRGHILSESGVCIVSQLLAEQIMKIIMESKNLTLEQLTDGVLELVKKHVGGTDLSKTFVNNICNLFISRRVQDVEKRGSKPKFSPLVNHLGTISGKELEHDAHERVIRVMNKCFEITKHAIVGQQLARYNIEIENYEAAEKAIQMSIDVMKNNSYLLDTYGQVFKIKMERESKKWLNSTSGKEVRDIIKLAFDALDKFQEGQLITLSFEEGRNDSCFLMEVSTFSFLLKFLSRHCGDNELKDFLNNRQKPAKESILNIVELEDICLGGIKQVHAQETLRKIDDLNYQVLKDKKSLYTDYADSIIDDAQFVFNKWYKETGSSTRDHAFQCGLRYLMSASKDDTSSLKERVDIAKRNIKSNGTRDVDFRDLMVSIGYDIIQISSHVCVPTESEYNDLLDCASKFLDKQKPFKKPFLESYLYFGILHFPAESRLRFKNLCKVESYKLILKDWEKAYRTNYNITTDESVKSCRPMAYFALGKGSIGNDIVNMEHLKVKGQAEKHRYVSLAKKHVHKDSLWKEPIVADKVERLSGTLDDNGVFITYQATSFQDTKIPIKILSAYTHEELKNRLVTFVLGFSFAGLRAYDVNEAGLGISKRLAVKDIFNVAQCIKNDREQLASSLGITAMELDDIKRKKQTEHLQKSEIMIRWRDHKDGQQVTIENLLNIIGKEQNMTIDWDGIQRHFGDEVLKHRPKRKLPMALEDAHASSNLEPKMLDVSISTNETENVVVSIDELIKQETASANYPSGIESFQAHKQVVLKADESSKGLTKKDKGDAVNMTCTELSNPSPLHHNLSKKQKERERKRQKEIEKKKQKKQA